MSLRYQGREVTVGEGRKSATLGRAEDNDVVVKGNLISRVHARVEASRDKFTLVDESTNGTFVQTNAGEEIFVRRDSTQLTGEGVIGLGRVAQPGTALAVHYVVEDRELPLSRCASALAASGPTAPSSDRTIRRAGKRRAPKQSMTRRSVL